jgi:hypothetical protein
MTSFGLRATTPAPSPHQAPGALPSSTPRPRFFRLALAALAVPAALSAAYIWFYVLKMPFERPVGPLFDTPRTPREGWAAWYVSPLVAVALTLVLFRLYFRKSHRWTVLGLTFAGAIAVVLGSTSAFWVKNIDYTWYSVPEADLLAILNALSPMLGFAFARGADALIRSTPLSFPTGALFGTVLALLIDLPWRHTSAGVTVSSPPAAPLPVPKAGMIGRLATTAVMTLFVTTVAVAGLRGIGVEVAPLVALIWWFLSFRGGRYDFTHVLIGSALLGAVSTLPLFVTRAIVIGLDGPMAPSYSFDPGVIALGFVTRTPVYLLVSVVVIKIALVLSKATGEVMARLRTAGRP